jgi:hypothetical protein
MAAIMKLQAEVSRIGLGVDRIETNLEAQTRATRMVLGTVLALSNEELHFPRTFLVLPLNEVGKIDTGVMSNFSRAKKQFINGFDMFNHFIMIFICENTFTPLSYGDRFHV